MLQKLRYSLLVCLFLFVTHGFAHEIMITELPMGHWTISPDSKRDGSEITFHDGSKYFVPFFYRSRVAKWEPGDEVEATFYGFYSSFTSVTIKNLNKNSSADLTVKKIPEVLDNALWISYKESEKGLITLNNGTAFKALDKSAFFGLSTIVGSKLFYYWKEGDLIAIMHTKENGRYDLLNLTLWQAGSQHDSVVRCELVIQN